MTAGSGWPSYFFERGLRVEAIDVREAAVHEEEDDALDALRIVELGDSDIAVGGDHRRGFGERLPQHAGKRHHAEAAPHTGQCLSASYWNALFVIEHLWFSPHTHGAGSRHYLS